MIASLKNLRASFELITQAATWPSSKTTGLPSNVLGANELFKAPEGTAPLATVTTLSGYLPARP